MMNNSLARVASKSRDQKGVKIIDQTSIHAFIQGTSINQSTLSKDNHANHGLNDQCCPQICKKCIELQQKIKQLETIIQKMGSNLDQNLSSSKEIHSPIRKANTNNLSKNLSTPRLRYSYGTNDTVLESQGKLLHDIEQMAIQLRKKDKKKTQIIKKIVNKSHNGDTSELAHNNNEVKTEEKGKTPLNASLNLSKSQISPIKQIVDKQVKITKSQSQLLEEASNFSEEISKPEQMVIRDTPNLVLIEDISRREIKHPILPNDNSHFDHEQLDAILDSRMNKVGTSKAQQEFSENSNLKSSHISLASKEKIAEMSPQEIEEHYKNQMRKNKMMAKFKRKKQ